MVFAVGYPCNLLDKAFLNTFDCLSGINTAITVFFKEDVISGVFSTVFQAIDIG